MPTVAPNGTSVAAELSQCIFKSPSKAAFNGIQQRDERRRAANLSRNTALGTRWLAQREGDLHTVMCDMLNGEQPRKKVQVPCFDVDRMKYARLSVRDIVARMPSFPSLPHSADGQVRLFDRKLVPANIYERMRVISELYAWSEC